MWPNSAPPKPPISLLNELALFFVLVDLLDLLFLTSLTTHCSPPMTFTPSPPTEDQEAAVLLGVVSLVFVFFPLHIFLLLGGVRLPLSDSTLPKTLLTLSFRFLWIFSFPVSPFSIPLFPFSLSLYPNQPFDPPKNSAFFFLGLFCPLCI